MSELKGNKILVNFDQLEYGYNMGMEGSVIFGGSVCSGKSTIIDALIKSHSSYVILTVIDHNMNITEEQVNSNAKSQLIACYDLKHSDNLLNIIHFIEDRKRKFKYISYKFAIATTLPLKDFTSNKLYKFDVPFIQLDKIITPRTKDTQQQIIEWKKSKHL